MDSFWRRHASLWSLRSFTSPLVFWALREQDDTREVAISFKQLLQERGSEV